jgi:hypothetical protein
VGSFACRLPHPPFGGHNNDIESGTTRGWVIAKSISNS